MNASCKNLLPEVAANPKDRLLSVVFYENEKKPAPKHQLQLEFADLCRVLARRHTRKEKSGMGFSMVALRAGTSRSNANVVRRSGIECDIDRGATFDEIKPRIATIAYCAYSTHNHNPNEGCIKYRIVIPFSRDVNQVEWPDIWRGVNALLGGNLDPACSDISRLVFLPSCPGSAKDHAFYSTNEGDWLNPDEIKIGDTSSPVSTVGGETIDGDAPPPTSENFKRARSMLAIVSADCPYEKWRAVLWSLASTEWPEARDMARDWSLTAPHRFDEVAFQRVWNNYDLHHPNRIRFGTLIHYARDAGWLEPAGHHELATAEPGDILASRIFAKRVRGALKWVGPAGKWLRFDGDRWSWCNRDEHMAAAKGVADSVLQSAANLLTQDNLRHRRRMEFALRLQNLNRLDAMIELSKSEPEMSVGHLTELDSDPWLLGVRNGVVNLKTGTLLRSDPKMLITRQTAASHQVDAECPRWLAFLDSIFPDDDETPNFLQRALGYTLTGVTTEEVLFICYGSGANGKSVFANVLTAILADYGQMAPPSLLTVRREGDSGPRNDIARICGARLLQINELNQGDRLDEQVVKMLAGREMLSARFLHREYFDFWPTAKPWLRTNHRPIITGEDDGIWRRILLIPFRQKFAESERDPWLESRLLEERDGILAWMVHGCSDWQRLGLKPSPTVRRESAAYRKESDLLGEFLDEATEPDPNSRVDQATLYLRWRQWSEANGTRYGAKASFTRKLAERGIVEVKSNGQRYYGGVKLKGGR